MTAVTLQNPDLLRRLAGPDPVRSYEALAAEMDRDPSNLRKTIKRLEGEGTVNGFGLTDLGRRVLAGLDIAEGRAAHPIAGPGDIVELHPSRLRPDPDQPRKTFDPAALETLAQSIADKGVLLPILVRPAAPVPATDDAYPGQAHVIIAGERRWRACMKIVAAGEWPDDRTVTVRIATPDDEAEAFETAVVENMQREDLNHMEMGHAFERMAGGGRSNKEIAEAVGKTPEFVQQHRRLTKLEAADQARVASGALTMHDALFLLRPEKAKAQSYERRFDRLNPEHTVADYWPYDGEVPEARDLRSWLEPGTFASFSLPDGYDDRYPRALIQIAALRGGKGWVYGAGYSLDVGHHERLQSVYVDKEAFPDRETAIAAGIDLIRDSLGRAKNGTLPVAIETWLSAMAEPDSRPAPDADEPQPKPTGPHVVNGVDYFNATRAQEARYAQGIDKRTEPNSGSGAAKGPEAAPAGPLTPRQRLIMLELAHKVAEQKRAMDMTGDDAWTGEPAVDFLAFGCSVGRYWLDQGFNELSTLRLIRAGHQSGATAPIAGLTPKGIEWFTAEGIPLPPTVGQIEDIQGQCGQAGHWHAMGYVTEWLSAEAQAPGDIQTPTGDAPAALRNDDPWDRDEAALAADKALQDKIVVWVAAPDGLNDAAQHFEALGVVRATVNPAGGVDLCDVDSAIVTVDVDARQDLPDERVAALEHLVAWAVNRATGAC